MILSAYVCRHFMNAHFASPSSLEAKHLILVWIMKVKRPKNQADFLEVLYVYYS